jgi:hypothetical protein
MTHRHPRRALPSRRPPRPVVGGDLFGLQLVNATPVSSSSSVELIMFIPCCATHRADSRPPAPHQLRSDSPSAYGRIGSNPLIPVYAGSARATPSPASAFR